MNQDILKRAMFAMPLSKSARNSGILAGFEDEEEMEMPDMESANLEDMPSMARTPQNPEILMNTLRGDIRSADSRYQELAEMVGEEAAYETPPEVLAMLQPVLAQQQGIASLGAAPAMPGTPPQGGMPPGMPPGMPQGAPAGMPPGMPPGMPAAQGPGPAAGGIGALPAAPQAAPVQGYAHGGVVQHFKDGSDEEGVTPAAIYPPELVEAAKKWASSQLNTVTPKVPDLKTTMDTRLPMYKELLGLGRSKEDMQTQMLLDIAGRGFAFAGNVDEQGRPLRGSFASRLGQVTRTLPATIMALSAEQRKGELAAKQLALQASETEIKETRDAISKDVENKRRLFTDILKEQAKANGQSIFGKGDWQWAVVNRPGFLANWASGKTTPDQDNLINSAITLLETPRVEYRSDPVTGQPVQVQVPAVVPQFVKDAKAARAKLFGGATGEAKPATGGPRTGASGAAGAAAAGTSAPGATAAGAPAERRPPSAFSMSEPTLFNLAGKGTGPIPVSKAFIARVPILGEFVNADEEVQANTYLSNAVNQINRSIATSPRFAEGERKQIQSELGLFPRLIDRPEAYHQRLIGLDTLLTDIRGKAYREGYQNPNLGPESIRAARQKVGEIDSIRSLLGVPPRISSKAEFDALPSSTPYILNGQLLMKR